MSLCSLNIALSSSSSASSLSPMLSLPTSSIIMASTSSITTGFMTKSSDLLSLTTVVHIQSNLILNWKVASRGSGHEQHLQSHVWDLPQRLIAKFRQRFFLYLSRNWLANKWSHILTLSVGNCMVNRYNRGGGQQTGNAICILALNMINDKVLESFNHQLINNSNFILFQVFAFCWYLHMMLIVASIHRWD